MPSTQLLSLNLLPTCWTTKPLWITCPSTTPNLTKFLKSLTPLLERPQTLRLFKKFPPSLRRRKSPISTFTRITSILIILKPAPRCSSSAKRITLQTYSTLSNARISPTSLFTSTATPTLPRLLKFPKSSTVPHTRRTSNSKATFFIQIRK